MVEGHSVHRIAVSHARKLVGKRVQASSPNGRFVDGARQIDGSTLSRMEAIGKNLFAFWAVSGQPEVVMHVHFGMSGRWSIVESAKAKEPTPTTRLRVLTEGGLTCDLSAMTVQSGGTELFESKRSLLGQDPLRADADVDKLWAKVRASTKSIGLLLMDQALFAGVGNIFRCEILFVAGIHPETPGKMLTREEFDRVWGASVALMQRSFSLGSIVTVDPAEASALGKPSLRRYIYNSGRCGRCSGPVRAWQINARTCYACEACQPRRAGTRAPADAAPPQLFHSLCASETLEQRLSDPVKLKVAELRSRLLSMGLPTAGKKQQLIDRLLAHLAATEAAPSPSPLPPPSPPPPLAAALLQPVRKAPVGMMRSARAAAKDKRAIHESRAVEHVAELDETADLTEWLEVPAPSSPKGGKGLETEGVGDGPFTTAPRGGKRRRAAE
jgi:formamidopyrimidine-DNA glycosylase